MKRKSLSVQRLNNVLLKDKKILNLYSNLKKFLLKNIKNKPFAVAVSGGPDSLALAGLSNILVNQNNYQASFILVDHGIRKNSAKEACQVKKLFKKQDIK